MEVVYRDGLPVSAADSATIKWTPMQIKERKRHAMNNEISGRTKSFHNAKWNAPQEGFWCHWKNQNTISFADAKYTIRNRSSIWNALFHPLELRKHWQFSLFVTRQHRDDQIAKQSTSRGYYCRHITADRFSTLTFFRINLVLCQFIKTESKILKIQRW